VSRPGREAWRYRTVGPVELYLGDARQVLAAMPDASVDCVATSPPFWALRDYGTGGWAGGDPGCSHHSGRGLQLPGTACRRCPAVWADPQHGLEPTVEKYVDRLAAVFDELARVLKPSGTCWLNLGDRYTGGPRRAHPLGAAPGGAELPDKQLVGVPWRVAFALQARGWWLRNAVVWAKSNPMPESVTDRLSTGYELLFLLTRSHRYSFDLDPIRQPLKRPDAGGIVIGGTGKGRTGGVDSTSRRRGASSYTAGKYADSTAVEPAAARGALSRNGQRHTAAHPRGRNPGDVWRLPTRPYRGAHVAPWPIDLPLRAIAAGCPPGGLVLDPFSGAATTGLAAVQLGRRYAGIDISPAFHDEALSRLAPYLPAATGGGPDG
jgi:DNA modification methylase